MFFIIQEIIHKYSTPMKHHILYIMLQSLWDPNMVAEVKWYDAEEITFNSHS